MEIFKTKNGVVQQDNLLSPIPFNTPNYTTTEIEELTRLQNMAYYLYTYSYSQIKFLEFNDLSFYQRYSENQKLSLGWSAYKDDENDPFLTTGKIKKKVKVIKNFVTKYNFRPKIEAFDSKNIKLEEIGVIFSKLVKKSRELEDYNKKRGIYLQELIEQGTIFVEEKYSRQNFPVYSTNNWDPTMPISQFKPDDKPIYKFQEKCETKIHLGTNVYFSNFNEPDIKKQQQVIVYEEMSRDDFLAEFGEWDRVRNNNIPASIITGQPTSLFKQNNSNNSGSFYNWNLTTLTQQNRVGILKIYEPLRNRMQIFANGTMLLPVGFPMTAYCPAGKLPIVKGTINDRPNFAYGISEVQIATPDQYMADKYIRGLDFKMQQIQKPTLGTKSQQKFDGNELYNSKSILRGIKDKDTIFPVLPVETRTITDSEINIFSLINNLADEKLVSKEFEGTTTDQYQTATQTVNNSNHSLLSVQSIIDGWIKFEKDLINLRLINILQNYTSFRELDYYEDALQFADGAVEIFNSKIKRNIKKKIYQSFMIDNEDGESLDLIRFTDKNKTSEELDVEEKEMSKQRGKKVFISEVNVNLLKKIDILWNVDIIAQPDRDDQNSLSVEINNFNQILGLLNANKQSGNLIEDDFIKQEFSRKMGYSSKELFGEQLSSQLPASLKNRLNKMGLFNNEDLQNQAPPPTGNQPQVSTPPNPVNAGKSAISSILNGSQLPSGLQGKTINPANTSASLK